MADTHALGFIGTGTIAAAMIDGLAATGDERILVSPRNAGIAARLAARHRQVSVAADNQAVLDGAARVVLAVRPQVVEAVLGGLRFRPDHQVLSLIATVSLDRVRALAAPAAAAVRAVPVPAVARCQGPTALFPPDPAVIALFDRLGTAIPLDDEAAFDAFMAGTATMGAYFAFADTIAAWLTRNGVDPAGARAFVAQLLIGLGGAIAAAPDSPFAALAEEHQTRGGLNEQVVRAITEDGTMPELDRALDGVLERLKAGRPR